MADGLDEQAFLRIAGDDGRAGVAAGEHGLAGIEHEPALDFISLVAVAFEAAVGKDRADFLLKERDSLPLARGGGGKWNGDEEA